MDSTLSQSKLICFLATKDSRRAREFYEKVLGLKFVSNNEFALVLNANGTILRIQKIKDFIPQKHTALGWKVTNISAEVTRLTKRGVKFARYTGMDQDKKGIWTTPGGAKVAWFNDPDGNILSLTQFP